ncbi:RDD family protein [Micrococcales bacterium 31B]|nr:RDD family protein [Micrococcales bacterium 31B]
MSPREDLGSWISGPPQDPNYVRGTQLGLPAEGPGSVAFVGRRFVAVCIDWALCLVISFAFFQGNSWVTLAIFFVENLLLVGTVGYTIGHRIMGLRVLNIYGNYAGWLKTLIRTALLLLVLPGLICDRDGRGVHDRLAATMIIRLGAPTGRAAS